MSAALTTPQVRDQTKTVTRRLGWHMLRVGDRFTLCPKVRGRKNGEPLERITTVVVTVVRCEPLNAITPADLTAEGFPQITAQQFIEFFCASHRGCRADTIVTRIQWRYLDGPRPAPVGPAGET